MKKAAFLFLFIFTLVQTLPVVNALHNQSSIVLLIDEENGENYKKQAEQKEKKEYGYYTLFSTCLAEKMNTAFHAAEAIHASPCLETLTPPPNFC
jgi:hypothetical protein